ncbi:hypothetical protein IH879_00660 [candidate division KSB1 bacterium]|nr:hypothetical protein [candidate division KSB1 bacterium]
MLDAGCWMLDAGFWMVVVFFEHQATSIEKQATNIEKKQATSINYKIEGLPIQLRFWRYLPKWNIRN